MDEAKPQFTVWTILKATLWVALWLGMFRYAPVIAVFFGLTIPLIVALRLRKLILATPVVNYLLIRLPLFLTLLSMFYIGALGPFAAVVSITGADRRNDTLTVAVWAAFAPAWALSVAMPPLHPLIKSYVDAWVW